MGNGCCSKHKFNFKNPLYAIDSTTIDLFLSCYNWAYCRKYKGAIKLHTELDLSGNLLCFLLMSNGKMSEIRAAKDNITILPDSSEKSYQNSCCRKYFQGIGASKIKGCHGRLRNRVNAITVNATDHATDGFRAHCGFHKNNAALMSRGKSNTLQRKERTTSPCNAARSALVAPQPGQ